MDVAVEQCGHYMFTDSTKYRYDDGTCPDFDSVVLGFCVILVFLVFIFLEINLCNSSLQQSSERLSSVFGVTMMSLSTVNSLFRVVIAFMAGY